MQYFHYEVSPKKLSIQYAVGYILCISCFLIGGLYLVSEGQYLIGMIFLLILLAIPKSIWHYLKIKNADHHWKITITDEEVIWDAPNNLGKAHDEKSFRLKLNEIEKIKKVISKSFSDQISEYFLVVKGTDIQIETQSGVSIFKFIKALEKAGVLSETIYEEN